MSHCLGCDPVSIKIPREANFNKRSASHKHSVCCRCNRHLCSTCVQKLVEALARDRNEIHPDCDECSAGPDHCLDKKVSPDDFVGNCCSIAEGMCKEKISSREKHHRHQRREHGEKHLLSGLFCLPECRLIIDNDLGSINVLVFAKSENID